jgi:hypothetical protein
VAERLAQFERHYEQIAQPFQWRFTRRNRNDWLKDFFVVASALRADVEPQARLYKFRIGARSELIRRQGL